MCDIATSQHCIHTRLKICMLYWHGASRCQMCLLLIQICRTLVISLSEKFALKIQIQCNLKLETDGILLQVLPYSMSSLHLTMFISLCIGIYCFHAGVGVGSEFCGPESPGLRDPNIWVVTVGKLWQYGVQNVKCKHTSL